MLLRERKQEINTKVWWEIAVKDNVNMAGCQVADYGVYAQCSRKHCPAFIYKSSASHSLFTVSDTSCGAETPPHWRPMFHSTYKEHCSSSQNSSLHEESEYMNLHLKLHFLENLWLCLAILLTKPGPLQTPKPLHHVSWIIFLLQGKEASETVHLNYGSRIDS